MVTVLARARARAWARARAGHHGLRGHSGKAAVDPHTATSTHAIARALTRTYTPRECFGALSWLRLVACNQSEGLAHRHSTHNHRDASPCITRTARHIHALPATRQLKRHARLPPKNALPVTCHAPAKAHQSTPPPASPTSCFPSPQISNPQPPPHSSSQPPSPPIHTTAPSIRSWWAVRPRPTCPGKLAPSTPPPVWPGSPRHSSHPRISHTSIHHVHPSILSGLKLGLHNPSVSGPPHGTIAGQPESSKSQADYLIS